MLDTICQHYYGHLIGTVEAVLDANQGLSDEVQPFRAGLLIRLPVVAAAVDETVTLWD
jgi:phage tail protein X